MKLNWDTVFGGNKILMAIATRLTLAGHELLRSIDNDKVWSKVKDRFAEAGVSMTVTSVLKVSKQIEESILGV